MHSDISASLPTTVNSSLKALSSRIEQLFGNQVEEEISPGLSEMRVSRSTSSRMPRANAGIGKASRALRDHGASPASNPASALLPWTPQHPLSSMSVNQKQPAPLVRWLSSSTTSRSTESTPDDSPASSRPPTPALTSLNEALSDTILPALPPPVQLPPCFTPSRLLQRPPPMLSNILSAIPSTSLMSNTSPIQDELAALSDSAAIPVGRKSPTHSSSTRSSIDTLRSIHTSAAPQVTASPAPSRWWFQSDSDTGSKENVNKLLNEEDQVASLNKIRQKYRSPKSPVVFCHGLLGFDTVTVGPALAPLQVAHWRGIKEALESNGCEVLITRVPATSSPVDRAKVLEKKISEVYPGRAVHLIGHSMGGLDCRYLTTHLSQRKFSVLSITTIATPHRGSSFADHFMSLASQHLPSVLALLELLPNGGGDGKAFECLTLESMLRFNKETPDVDGVRYFSWGASYEPGLIDTWKWPHSVILEKEGPNDGLVSVESAKWGTYLGTLSPVNHLDLVGWTNAARYTWAAFRGKEIPFKPASFYLGIADLLAGVEGVEGKQTLDGVVEGYQERMERNALDHSPLPMLVPGPLPKMHPALEEMVSKMEEESKIGLQRPSRPAEASDNSASPDATPSSLPPTQRSLPPTPPRDEPPTPPSKSTTPSVHTESPHLKHD